MGRPLKGARRQESDLPPSTRVTAIGKCANRSLHYLAFWARAEEDCVIEFKVGGICESYGDTLRTPRQIRAKLTPK